jgi:hypothetical protein
MGIAETKDEGYARGKNKRIGENSEGKTRRSDIEGWE